MNEIHLAMYAINQFLDWLLQQWWPLISRIWCRRSSVKYFYSVDLTKEKEEHTDRIIITHALHVVLRCKNCNVPHLSSHIFKFLQTAMQHHVKCCERTVAKSVDRIVDMVNELRVFAVVGLRLCHLQDAMSSTCNIWRVADDARRIHIRYCLLSPISVTQDSFLCRHHKYKSHFQDKLHKNCSSVHVFHAQVLF